MMPYQAYQLYQIERAKSAAEIRRADKQLGLMAEAVSRLWHRVTQPIAVMRAWFGTRTPQQSGKSAAPPHRPNAASRPVPPSRSRP
jgi:hypothetical protein